MSTDFRSAAAVGNFIASSKDGSQQHHAIAANPSTAVMPATLVPDCAYLRSRRQCFLLPEHAMNCAAAREEYRMHYFVASIIASPVLAQPVFAQTWPQRPVTFIVSQSAGA